MSGPTRAEVPLTLYTLARHLRYARGSDQAKVAAKAFIGKPLINLETGFRATASGENFKKMLSRSAVEKSVFQQAHHQALANVDKLFALATLGRSRLPEREGDIGEIAQLHHFDVPMPFDGRVLWVKLLVKEMVNKNFANPLYTLSVIEINKKPSAKETLVSGGSDSREVGLPTGRPEGFEQKFAAMASQVKCGMGAMPPEQ